MIILKPTTEEKVRMLSDLQDNGGGSPLDSEDEWVRPIYQIAVGRFCQDSAFFLEADAGRMKKRSQWVASYVNI